MPLDVIGTGFGRTGTNSLRLALQQLGFGPCHHMFAVREQPQELACWQAAVRGEAMDWDEVFANWRSAVDWPSAAFWRETTAHFPQAKVIHSTRSPESWHRSAMNTIFRAMGEIDTIAPGPRRERMKMANDLVRNRVFGGDPTDPELAIRVFRAHEAEVLGTIPKDRLLIYELGSGWEPLCDFLGVPVPDAPYPETNSTADFQARVLPSTK